MPELRNEKGDTPALPLSDDWRWHADRMAAGWGDPNADTIHFWHPDLLDEVHEGSGTGGPTCSDDLRQVDCNDCRAALVAAVRAMRTAPRVNNGE